MNRLDAAADAATCVVVIAVVAGGSALIWWGGGGTWFEQSALNVIGYVGAAVSLVGVLLAYLIFRRQSREAKSTDRYQRRVLTDLERALAGVDEKISNLALQQAINQVSDADVEQTLGGAEDLWDAFKPESEDAAVYLSSPSGKRRRVYDPSRIPLAVVAALVKGWDEHGLSGRWALGTLRGAFRAEGKGNHPWYLVLVPPEEEAPIIWKVSRGPQGSYAVQVKNSQEFR